MDSQMKLGAILLSGYLLGRTKKGGMALRLATRMVLSGTDANPRELVQENLLKALQSDVVEQLRAQAMEAAKAAVDARVQGIAQNLTDRTEALKGATETVGETTDAASDAASETTDTLTKTVTGDKEEESEDEQSEPEDQQAEGEAEGGEGEGEEPEPADEGDEPDDSDEDQASWIETRTADLKKKRVTTLRRMAKEMFENEDEIDETDKATLARWIAEEEADSEEED